MRNFSIVALMFFSLIGVAQSDNDQKQNRLSVYAGLWAFPFGLSSVPVSSRKDFRLTNRPIVKQK